MTMWKYKGKEFERDEDGYLTDWQVWEEGMAEEMAKGDDTILTEQRLGDHQVSEGLLHEVQYRTSH